MSKFNFIYTENLSHREKTVYIYLRDRADASGVCWPGIKTIAGELGLSPRTVQRALADLEHRQLIEKRQRHRANGSLTSNLYRLTAAKSHSLPPRGDCDLLRKFCQEGGVIMAHPEEPTLPEDIPVQRKNKNINNVLHDIGPFVVGMVFSENPL